MESVTIYHNARCGKSRGALEILQQHNIPFTIRWYLTEPLNKNELKALVKKLQIQTSGLVRKNESLYKEQYAGKEIIEKEWISILAEHPVLIERPIVETADSAIIARPPELLLEFLKLK